MSRKAIWPHGNLIRRVVNHLEKDLGLSIYGLNADLETGQGQYGQMDYDLKRIMKLRKLLQKGGELTPPDDSR